MSDRYSIEPTNRVLRRSRNDRMIAGVMGGIAKYFRVDPTVLRVLFVVISVVSVAVPGALIYLLMWLIVPEAGPEEDVR